MKQNDNLNSKRKHDGKAPQTEPETMLYSVQEKDASVDDPLMSKTVKDLVIENRENYCF